MTAPSGNTPQVSVRYVKRDNVKNPWAIGALKGPLAALSTST